MGDTGARGEQGDHGSLLSSEQLNNRVAKVVLDETASLSNNIMEVSMEIKPLRNVMQVPGRYLMNDTLVEHMHFRQSRECGQELESFMASCDVEARQCTSAQCMEGTSRLSECLQGTQGTSLAGETAWTRLGGSEQGSIVQKSIQSV